MNFTLPIEGCNIKEGKRLSFCNEESKCIYHLIDKNVPKEWKCPSEFYGTNDGCDCNCGIKDPDCKNENEDCDCKGEIEITSIQNEILIYIILISSIIIFFLKFFQEFFLILLKKIF